MSQYCQGPVTALMDLTLRQELKTRLRDPSSQRMFQQSLSAKMARPFNSRAPHLWDDSNLSLSSKLNATRQTRSSKVRQQNLTSQDSHTTLILLMKHLITLGLSVTSSHNQFMLSYNPLKPLHTVHDKDKLLWHPSSPQCPAHKGIQQSLNESTFQSNLMDEDFLIAFSSL